MTHVPIHILKLEKANKNLQTNIEFGSFAIEKALGDNKDAYAKTSLKDGFLAPLYFVNQAFDPELHPYLLPYVHKNVTSPLVLISKWPIYLLAVGVLGNGLPENAQFPGNFWP